MIGRTRAQSETVGVVLLTGVFVVFSLTVGVFVVSNVLTAAEDAPLIDANASATTQNVTVSHHGGASVRVDAVEVVLDGDTRARYPLSDFDQIGGGRPDRFDVGDHWRRANDVGGDRLTVLLIHRPSNDVVDRMDVAVVAAITAQFTYQPEDPSRGETITFDAGASSVEGSSLSTYAWDFDDDGSTDATGETATHQYGTTGDQPVTLTVTATDGRTATRTRTVSVGNEPPTAAFQYSPDSPSPGESVTFDASGSTDDGAIASYQWTFGDGTAATGEITSHAFDDSGTYTVTLTVTDDDGATDATSTDVTVTAGNQPPTPAFETREAEPSQGRRTEVVYDATAAGDPDGTLVQYEWDIDGDGNFETSTQDPIYRHDAVDTSTGEVTLRVTDDDGATATRIEDGEIQSESPGGGTGGGTGGGPGGGTGGGPGGG